MIDLGYTVIGDQPEQFVEFINADIERWKKVVHQTGMTAD